MTRLPAPILPPARAATANSASDLSLTVIVEQYAHRSARRFAFHACRQEQFSTDHHVHEERLCPTQTFLTADALNTAAAILDRHDVHDSARFLAGAIAQARPGAMLHNPPYREAMIAYRRSDALGVQDLAPHVLTDKRI